MHLLTQSGGKVSTYAAIGRIGHHSRGLPRFGRISRKSLANKMLPRTTESGEKFQISWLLDRLVIIVEDCPDLDGFRESHRVNK